MTPRPGKLRIESSIIEENLEPCVRFEISYDEGDEPAAVLIAADDAWEVMGNVAQACAIATSEASLAQFLIHGGASLDEAYETIVATRRFRADRWATEGSAVTEQGPITI